MSLLFRQGCLSSGSSQGTTVLRMHRKLRQRFFFQAEDGIRDVAVTGVQTCALPICTGGHVTVAADTLAFQVPGCQYGATVSGDPPTSLSGALSCFSGSVSGSWRAVREIGRASCRERGHESVDARALKRMYGCGRGIA